MDHARSVFRKMFSVALISGMAVLVTGCSVTASRTVALPGLAPLAGGDQVRLVKNLEDVKEPYQIVGQVSLACPGGPLHEGVSFKRMKEIAAGMGADGLIGLHYGGYPQDNGANTTLRTGLAVKWLTPGQAKRPLTAPFLVALLPVQDQTAPDKEAKMSQMLLIGAMFQLESKGYYVYFVKSADFLGGVEKVKALSDIELAALGGNDAQQVLVVTVEESAKTNMIVMEQSSFTIRATLLDKQSRKTVFEGFESAAFGMGWLGNAISPNTKTVYAAISAAEGSLSKLPAINQQVED